MKRNLLITFGILLLMVISFAAFFYVRPSPTKIPTKEIEEQLSQNEK